MLFPVLFSYFPPKKKAVARLLLTLSAGLFSLPVHADSETYVPYSGIIHGTDGADPVEVSIMNATGGPLDCRAALAHWYSDELGRIVADGQLTLTFWHDSETGVLNLMNATNDRMPVEAVWCATDTARTRLDLPMTTGQAEAKLHFTCEAVDGANLTCDAMGG
ncbi:hypothetical protein OO012_05075 [Rhodobacteraceae bacterium KMM 6894]|nr:hypothetical protein [Rhodobacteraceae bacterium KMM 6894]